MDPDPIDTRTQTQCIQTLDTVLTIASSLFTIIITVASQLTLVSVLLLLGEAPAAAATGEASSSDISLHSDGMECTRPPVACQDT